MNFFGIFLVDLKGLKKKKKNLSARCRRRKGLERQKELGKCRRMASGDSGEFSPPCESFPTAFPRLPAPRAALEPRGCGAGKRMRGTAQMHGNGEKRGIPIPAASPSTLEAAPGDRSIPEGNGAAKSRPCPPKSCHHEGWPDPVVKSPPKPGNREEKIPPALPGLRGSEVPFPAVPSRVRS